MKVIFEIPNLMRSDVKEIPEGKHDYEIAIRLPLGVESAKVAMEQLRPRSLTFRNTQEIDHYTKYREPVFIFRLII